MKFRSIDFEADLSELLQDVTAEEVVNAFSDNEALLDAIGRDEAKEYFNLEDPEDDE
jgi:hypothetical protein